MARKKPSSGLRKRARREAVDAPASFDYEAVSLVLKKARYRLDWLDPDCPNALVSLERALENLQEFIRQTQDDPQLLAHYARFEKMRKRFGNPPTPEEYERANAAERVALIVRSQAHQVIARVMRDLALGGFQHEDAELLDELWRVYSMLPSALDGLQWMANLRNAGFLRYEADQAKHEQWRVWQADEIATDRRFGDYSKQEQARRLRKKHNIRDKVGTIAKRLS